MLTNSSSFGTSTEDPVNFFDEKIPDKYGDYKRHFVCLFVCCLFESIKLVKFEYLLRCSIAGLNISLVCIR